MMKRMQKKDGLVIFVSGHFNILHPGHLRLLKFAKDFGGKLIVGVFSDILSGESAHINQELRLEGISSNSLVDEAFIVDQPISQLVDALRPDIIVKGKEHEGRINEESEALKKYGGRLIFSSGESIFSSIDLIKKEFQESSLTKIMVPEEFMSRHGILKRELVDLINGFNRLKVVIIGDLIVDEYITCDPLGMSQEDPTIVITPVDSKKFIGGSGIVAAHAASLGADVTYITTVGKDHIKEFALNQLVELGVDPIFMVDDSRPTTLKQRFRCMGKTLMRVSHLHQEAISVELQRKIIQEIIPRLDGVDLMVFSDFNYGCLPQSLVDELIQICLEKRVLMVADSQSSSQFGDISRFHGVDLITPTEYEARISTRNREDGLVILAEQLRKNTETKNVLLKLGGDGMLIHSGGINGSWRTDKIPALNNNPKDVAGAGDSLLITTAMAHALKGCIWRSALLGSISASIQVGRVGNVPLKKEDLLSVLS